jgi:broad specificity phosphatase PhoE/predicted kinase
MTMSKTVFDNPMPHVIPEGANATPLEVVGATASEKLIIIMVGLPGSGKTFVAKRVCRYITFFLDIPSQIFNVGDYRRELCGAQMPASFYDPKNEQAKAERSKACDAALDDMIEFMKKDGVRLAVYDATNNNVENRSKLLERISEEGLGCKKMFVECLVDDQAMLDENFKNVKLSTPDYHGVDEQKALADFLERRQNYASVYESVKDEEGCYVRIINYRKFEISGVRGYIRLRVVQFLMNLHTMPRTFYMTRHGQSEYNVLGKIGGDSGLSQNGIEYARRLARFAKEVIATKTIVGVDGKDEKVSVPTRLWTSTLKRTIETAQFIEHDHIMAETESGDKVKWIQFRPNARRNLDEVYAGICDGMSYKEIEEVYPEEFASRQDDKLAYRYPKGESYMDVTLRLEPLANDLERIREPLLLIGHQGIIRLLYAYFMGLTREEAPYVKIPLNHVIILRPHAYGCHEETVCLMPKEEMFCDGQDEPVTSMPMKRRDISSTDLNAPSC